MKIEALHMSDAELEIMEYLWKEQRPVTAADIMRGLPHREWKPSTVHTIFMHLVDEGFVKFYKLNGKNYYVPYISDFDYSFVVTKAFVDEMHSGSIIEIVRTLLCDMELRRDELERLQDLVNAAVKPQESCGTTEAAPVEETAEEAASMDEQILVRQNTPFYYMSITFTGKSLLIRDLHAIFTARHICFLYLLFYYFYSSITFALHIKAFVDWQNMECYN